MQSIVEAQKTYFKTHETKSYQHRLEALTRLERLILDNEEAIKEALKADLNKSSFESYTTEIGFTLHSLKKAKKHLKGWMKPKKQRTPMYLGFTKSYIRHEPKGTVLIIGPYNYPFQLVVEPLIGAIAAGNTVIIKPSEFPERTETLIERIINDAFDSRHVHVITGGKETTQELLDIPFDHIFFTGSTRVGQLVYEAAAKHLTPVTLELGGKTPTIVHKDAKLDVAARRIAFGKLLNAGQTCIAPDHIYVHAEIQEAFTQKLIQTIDEFYTSQKDEYPTIINDRHFERVRALIDTKKLLYGGSVDAQRRFIEPTVLGAADESDASMQEEIFGPVLPIIPYGDLDDLIESLGEKPSPLALYVFSENKNVQTKVFERLRFGGGAINDTIMHVANPHMPFGGVGQSGMGRYHGRYSFETLSNAKAYVKKSTRIDPSIAYPPFSRKKERLVKKILK